MIAFEKISKIYDSDESGVAALTEVSFEIREGEFFSILGPSGCGKTTLLRTLAGFEEPTSGRVLIGGKDQNGVPPEKRPGHLVFQKGALFPHLNVRGNLEFSLKILGWSKDRRDARVREVLSLVKLEGFAEREIATLSGGQSQRVAIARALMDSPPLVLLDEPFSALDLQLRKEMRLEIAQLARRLKSTFVLVTHDQEEALALSDRVAILNQGRLEQVGSPEEIYSRPETRFVAEFVGEHNRLGTEWMRPEDCELRSNPPESIANTLNSVEVRVIERLFEGSTELWMLSRSNENQASEAQSGETPWIVRKPRQKTKLQDEFKVGDRAFLVWDPKSAIWSQKQ
jgi:spermidine/putrescine transport system ATP-binding protein